MQRGLLIAALVGVAAWLARPREQAGTGGITGWHWLIVGLGLQLLWVRLLSPHAAPPLVLAWIPSLAVLAALRFVWLNRRYRGLWLVAAGAGLNLLVMAANGGLMPIAPSSLHALGPQAQHGSEGSALAVSKNRVLGDGVARLAALDDRLVYAAGGLHVAGSVGDVLVMAGCLLTLGAELCGCAPARPRVAEARRHS